MWWIIIRWNPTCGVKKVKHNVYRRNVCLYFHHYFISDFHVMFHICVRCDMTFIEPMHRDKPNSSYLLHFMFIWILSTIQYQLNSIATTPMFQPCVLIKLSKNKQKAVTTAAKRCCNTSSENHLKLKSHPKSHPAITLISVVQSLRKFSQSMIMSLPCFVQNCKTNLLLRNT